MSGLGLRRALAYHRERQAAAGAHMDGDILARMGKVREVLHERAAHYDVPITEMVACVGPCEQRGFYVGAISFAVAKTIPVLAQLILTSPPSGQVLVFTWNHGGYATLRTLPIGE